MPIEWQLPRQSNCLSSNCAKLNLKQNSTTTTIPSIWIPKEMQPNFPNSFGPAKILV